MPNSLAQATSPYLLQHKDNPVQWRQWGTEALAEARARDVPILLSVGYAACHWCHVMAHESFENAEIAALMNEHFVNIKVDREERPDLDTVYQQALALLGQQGGWPLTMFLTPEGEPFWGGTYFPPEPRYGRASFPQVLEQVARLWREEREKIDGNRRQLKDALAKLATPTSGGIPGAEEAFTAARLIAGEFDTVHGGLGGAPKFPQAPILDFLWRSAGLGDDRTIRERVLHTLRRICQGGIFDHLGGGFARYSVDAFWLVPHFEKMLYDNAQLLRLLAEAHIATGDPLYRVRAEETVAWLRREMMVGPAFASSLDADSEGEEGRFYVWDMAEIRSLLGADAEAFALAYGITEAGNFEGRNIPNRLHAQGLAAPEEEARLGLIRARLLEARERRVRPARDDKVLADWNGLMITGLAEAGFRLGRADWLDMAEAAFSGILERMAENGRLFHSWREGRHLPMAFLDDYAQMARAAVALFEVTGKPPYLERAATWCATADALYRDTDGSYFLSAETGDGIVVRPRGGHDGPSPAAVGTLAETSIRLFQLTGEDGHRRRAEAILRAFGGEIGRAPAAHVSLLSAALLYAQPVQIVIVGDPAEATPLTDAVAGHPLVTRILARVPDGSHLPPEHPAAGKGLVDGAPAAYICVGPVCQAPVVDPARLLPALDEVARYAPA